MILHLMKIIDSLKETYLDHIRKSKVSTQLNKEERFEENPMSQSIVLMDNHFILPKFICALRGKGIIIVGTARYLETDWLSKEVKIIDKKISKFNFFTVDKYGTLTA